MNNQKEKKKHEIESGIPIPGINSYNWGPIINKMKEGDSVILTNREAQSFRRTAKKKAKLASRQLSNEEKKEKKLDPKEKTYRVWITHFYTPKELTEKNRYVQAD